MQNLPSPRTPPSPAVSGLSRLSHLPAVLSRVPRPWSTCSSSSCSRGSCTREPPAGWRKSSSAPASRSFSSPSGSCSAWTAGAQRLSSSPRSVPTGVPLAGRWFLCPLVSRVREALPGSGLGKGRFKRKYLAEQNAAFTSKPSVCWLPGAEPPDGFVPAKEQALFSGASLDCVYVATDY